MHAACARLFFARPFLVRLTIRVAVHGFDDLVAAVGCDLAVVREDRLLAVAQGAGDVAKLQHAHQVRDDIHVAPIADFILDYPVASWRRRQAVGEMGWPDGNRGLDERLKEGRAEGQNFSAVAACAFGEEEKKDPGADGFRHLFGGDGGRG